jgi:hypothetical protein
LDKSNPNNNEDVDDDVISAIDESNAREYTKPEINYSGLLLDGSRIPATYNHSNLTLSKYQIAENLGLLGVHNKENIIQFIDKERDKISKMFMMNEVNKSVRNDEHIQYSLKAIRGSINANMTDTQLLDILFYCPFKFPDYKKSNFETPKRYSPKKLTFI